MKELNFIIIGNKIRSRRKKLHLTQEYVANMLDVNPSHVSNIECGRANPSLTALVHIANILHCSVDCFLDDEYYYSSSASKTDAMANDDNPKNTIPKSSYDAIIDSSLDKRILNKLKNRDNIFKKKILKIIDII